MEIQIRTARLSLFTMLQVILYNLKSCIEIIAIVVGVDELNKVYDINYDIFKEIINQINRISYAREYLAQIFFVLILAGIIKDLLFEVITQLIHEVLPLSLYFLSELNAFKIARQINFD